MSISSVAPADPQAAPVTFWVLPVQPLPPPTPATDDGSSGNPDGSGSPDSAGVLNVTA